MGFPKLCLRIHLSYPGTFLVHPVMRQIFANALKCKLDFVWYATFWEEPSSQRLTRPASDDALIIDGNAVLHIQHQLAFAIKQVMLRNKYIVLNQLLLSV